MNTKSFNQEIPVITSAELIATPVEQLGALLRTRILEKIARYESGGYRVNWHTTREAQITPSGKMEIFATFNLSTIELTENVMLIENVYEVSSRHMVDPLQKARVEAQKAEYAKLGYRVNLFTAKRVELVPNVKAIIYATFNITAV